MTVEGQAQVGFRISVALYERLRLAAYRDAVPMIAIFIAGLEAELDRREAAAA